MAAAAQASPIKRSWKSTIRNLVIALVCIGIAVPMWMYMVEGPITVGIACLPSIVALIMLYMAFAGSGEGVCPLCGKTIPNISVGGPVLCDSCHKYLDTKGAVLAETDPGRIEATPTFTANLPVTFVFPDCCCVCGKAADHKQKISTSQMNASSAVTNPTIGVTSTTTISVEVPHCAEHKDGASLTGTASSMRIRFRSYPYMRQFCEMNQTTPA